VTVIARRRWSARRLRPHAPTGQLGLIGDVVARVTKVDPDALFRASKARLAGSSAVAVADLEKLGLSLDHPPEATSSRSCA
jgi:hypothetical protein